MDLVTSTGSSWLVKDVTIVARCTKTLRELHSSVYTYFAPDKNDWSGVRRLNVQFDYGVSDTDEPDGALQQEPKEHRDAWIRRLASALIEIMPNINVLDFYSFFSGTLAKEFTSELTNHLVPQLAELRSVFPMIPPKPCAAPNLTKLDIYLVSASVQLLPKLNLDILQVLDLKCGMRFFSWLHFCDSDTDVSEIRFSRLTVLSLHFSTYSPQPVWALSSMSTRDMNTQALFPRLQRLTVDGWPGNCMLFKNIVFPSRLQQLSCTNCTEALSQISGARDIQFISHIHIKASSTLTYDGYFTVLNHYFGSKIQCNSCELDDSHEDFWLSPMVSCWHRLTNADFSSIHYLVLLALVSKTPNLLKLIVRKLSMRRVYSNNQLFDMDEYLQTPAATANSSIKDMDLYNFLDSEHENDHKAVQCVQHLINSFDGLENLYVGMDICEYLLELLKMNQNDYPHIKKVQFLALFRTMVICE
ncbi:hypothetical protein H4R99_001281 [Coemansia sp. RSA 1722]|nr:hypothetical protein LPJ57_000540 [Coemansia sp. RSA 486]KAJ2605233.1 hypothetical protein H4R99_001281 [Coemansia sp. RSA 1722]